jgi:phage FluMu protein Com
MIDIKCVHCGRYIGKAETIVGILKCPNSSCKGETQFKNINNDYEKLFSYKFVDKPLPPKKELKDE